ncbi:MAG: thiolase family protein [Hyphomicrobium sp.]
MTKSYIVAARRTALGRVGGLHRNRRVDDLAAPVVQAVLDDCRVAPGDVDEIIIGNASEGGNPARLIALAAGLPERVAAATIDRQCGSGLDAILTASRLVASGEASVIVAGGAEALSMAPWRIAKPKSLYQLPHFMRLEPATSDSSDEPQFFEASELLSQRLGIGRVRQDAYAVRAHLKAEAARTAKRFVGEIVPLRGNAEEARDQSAGEPGPQDLERLTPFVSPGGTLTPGNTSSMHDGAAIVVVVSEEKWVALGKPRALRLVAGAIEGVSPDEEAVAPMQALKKLYQRLNGFNPKDIGIVEMSEASAAQALALAETFGFDDDQLNPDGGALVRGHPLGAAGAVLVVRLFTRMVRTKDAKAPRHGVATLGAIGGMGLAALFETV